MSLHFTTETRLLLVKAQALANQKRRPGGMITPEDLIEVIKTIQKDTRGD